jgi:hypothetical protein
MQQPTSQEALNDLIREVDAEQIANNKPILSVLVLEENTKPCDIFWESVIKYNLRHNNESDTHLIYRLAGEAMLDMLPASEFLEA